jgi:hydroxymethylpyrimidine kinase/phosphomethylpyrimidine kinase/thiamine-phosphate diphosphorylase
MTIVWSIAGHDPLGAAGIQADLRVAEQLNISLRTIIASFTAQNHRSMPLCEAVPDHWLKAQWDVLAEEEEAKVIKLGLLRSPATLDRLGRLLYAWPDCPIVCDPVLASSSGFAQATSDLLTAYREYIFPRVTLLTPNRPEAEQLLGYALEGRESIEQAARDLRSWGVRAVLIKGGHSVGPEVLDYFDDGQRPFWLAATRMPGSFRGTGCSLATAISCFLAQGLSLREAVVLGHGFLQAALLAQAGDERSILRFRETHPRLGRLSYDGYVPSQGFPAVDDGPLGFYPIVPDLEWLKRLLPTGIRTIQLRLKDKSERECAHHIAEANVLCRQADVRLFVNDHWQMALEEGVYGVHLGQEDLDRLHPSDFELLRSSHLRLGLSTHSYEEAARALNLGPSYIALGPILETTCKSMAFGPQGFARLDEWKRLCPDVPLVAIGGLKLEHAARVAGAGAEGLAVISDVLNHASPEQRAAQWMRIWQQQFEGVRT